MDQVNNKSSQIMEMINGYVSTFFCHFKEELFDKPDAQCKIFMDQVNNNMTF